MCRDRGGAGRRGWGGAKEGLSYYAQTNPEMRVPSEYGK